MFPLPPPPPVIFLVFLERALQILSDSRLAIFAQHHSDHSGLFCFFLTTFPLAFIPSPALHLHPLQRWKFFRLGVSPGRATEMRQEHSGILSVPHPWSGHLFPILPQGRHLPMEHTLFSVSNHNCSLSGISSAFMGYLLCVRPWERMMDQIRILASRTL